MMCGLLIPSAFIALGPSIHSIIREIATRVHLFACVNAPGPNMSSKFQRKLNE